MFIIITVSFALYFEVNLGMDEDERGFKFKKVSKLNRDDLGLRKGKSKRYYELMLKHFKIEEMRFVDNGKPVPDKILKRKERTEQYLAKFNN